MPTWSGRRVNLAEPRLEDIDPFDIAEHLSKLCRRQGTLHAYYSEAQHAVIVARACAPEWQAWALLYGAHAYLLGRQMALLRLLLDDLGVPPVMRALEQRLDAAIHARFGLAFPAPEAARAAVTAAAHRAAATEARDLMPSRRGDHGQPLPHRIKPLPPAPAAELWLDECRRLFPAIHVRL
jgi:hypothetical protein